MNGISALKRRAIKWSLSISLFLFRHFLSLPNEETIIRRWPYANQEKCCYQSLDLGLLVSIMVRKTFLLFKPHSGWHSVIGTRTD
jgi:hypothetical protein